MKRSRIICSIITVIYILLSSALILMLFKSNMLVKSSVPTYFKALYIATVAMCSFMYVGIKIKLSKKLANNSLSMVISRGYCYLYLAVVVFLSRIVMAYVLKDNVVENVLTGSGEGIGSYINYGLGKILNNQMYANVLINSLITFASCVIIKKILLNIIENDTVATTTSIIYIFIPQSLVYVNEYVKYSYNVLFVLAGIFVCTKIIDEVEKFGKKSNNYLLYSIILGVIASLDIILGGTYVLWLCVLLLITLAAMYVDTVHITISFKQKLNYKLKILAERLERINISKFIIVCCVVLTIAGITTLIYSLVTDIDNYQMFSTNNAIKILMHSRMYYLILLIISLVAEIIGVLLKRKLDIKMFMVKVGMITQTVVIFFMAPNVYTATVFDALLVLTVITNICNICYNREEKVKLLKEQN